MTVCFPGLKAEYEPFEQARRGPRRQVVDHLQRNGLHQHKLSACGVP